MTDSVNIALVGARVVLPGGVSDDVTIHVAGDLISRIVTGARRGPDDTLRGPDDATLAPNDAARSLDLRGLTLYPGFIDAHIHGAVGVDTMQATGEDLRRVARFLATRGVTSWLPTLVPAPTEDYRHAVASIATLMREQRREESSGGVGEEASGDAEKETAGDVDRETAGARALGVHYEGPFVNSAQCGALRTQFFRTFPNASALDDLAVLPDDLHAPGGARAARMMTVAPEIDGGVELVRALSSRGWVVSIGHTRADSATLDAALSAGARHMTHFFNAMPPLHHREPGVVGWGLTNDGVTCDVVADGIHCHPTALRLLLRCKTSRRLALISDAVLPAGLGDGEFDVWGEKIAVVAGRTRNARGSIAGSVITMLDAARTMLSLGCAPQEVARMASLNPAHLLGVSHLTGSIEAGKRADLVALDDEGRPRLTLVGGRVAFDERG